MRLKLLRQKNEASKGQKAAEADKRVFVQQQEALAVEGENVSRADIAAYNMIWLKEKLKHSAV